MLNSGFSNDLFTAAEAYLAIGYSVIPLYGDIDPDRAKQPTIAWSHYQQIPATKETLHQWAAENVFGALGIVTGRISGLVVLDFDNPELFKRFCRQHPDLAERKVIQTRRGYHIYYQLPPNTTLGSRKGQGIDLLSDGRYAVAPLSTINGYTYNFIRGGQPRLLNLPDIQRITRFLQDCATTLAKPSPKPQFTPISRDSESVQVDSIQVDVPTVTSRDLLTSYSYYAQQIGRNEALFRASLKARDAGWTESETLSRLLQVHVQQPPTHAHAPESHQRRAQEAIRTIHSAFSRPARPPKPHRANSQLPNHLREALFKQKRTDVVRTIEGLRLKGIQPGQQITTEQALTLLHGIVGQNSTYHAFAAQTPHGQPFFEQIPPSALPLAPDGAATDTHQKANKKLHFVREKNPRKMKSGRKKRVFIMPSNLELCAKLGVTAFGSDPLTLDDLASAKGTRMAVHRELIKRRPGIYSRRWLAKRVGVCRKTLDTYNRDIPISVKHLYIEVPITWLNLKQVPDNVQLDGTFLEDERGKRYPPNHQIAAKLLNKGHSVTYKRQDANYYWYGDTPPDLSILFDGHPRAQELETRVKAIQDYTQRWFQASKTNAIRVSKPPAATLPSHEATKWGVSVSETTHQPAVEHRPRRESGRADRYHKPLPDPTAEALAQHIYLRIQGLASDKHGQISLTTARKLVDQYGTITICQALNTMSQRHPVRSPAGFLIILLRSGNKGSAFGST